MLSLDSCCNNVVFGHVRRKYSKIPGRWICSAFVGFLLANPFHSSPSAQLRQPLRLVVWQSGAHRARRQWCRCDAHLPPLPHELPMVSTKAWADDDPVDPVRVRTGTNDPERAGCHTELVRPCKHWNAPFLWVDLVSGVKGTARICSSPDQFSLVSSCIWGGLTRLGRGVFGSPNVFEPGPKRIASIETT